MTPNESRLLIAQQALADAAEYQTKNGTPWRDVTVDRRRMLREPALARAVVAIDHDLKAMDLAYDRLRQQFDHVVRATKGLLDSASPHPTHHPAMFAAWGIAEAVLRLVSRKCPRPVYVDDGFPPGGCQRRDGHDGLCDVYDGRDDDLRRAKPWQESDGVLDFNGKKVL